MLQRGGAFNMFKEVQLMTKNKTSKMAHINRKLILILMIYLTENVQGKYG